MAVRRERISTEDHPQTSGSQHCPTSSGWAQAHPADPASTQSLSSSQPGPDSQCMWGCCDDEPSAHQAPPGLGLCFLAPRSHKRAAAETEQSSAALTNTFVLPCGQTTALLLKEVDAANQPQRKAVSFGGWASLHPLAAQDRSTHTVPEASLQAIPSSLSFWICLGCVFT